MKHLFIAIFLFGLANCGKSVTKTLTGSFEGNSGESFQDENSDNSGDILKDANVCQPGTSCVQPRAPDQSVSVVRDGALVCYKEPIAALSKNLMGKTSVDFDSALVRDTSVTPYYHQLWLKKSDGTHEIYRVLDRVEAISAAGNNAAKIQFIQNTYPVHRTWARLGSGSYQPASFVVQSEYFIAKSTEDGQIKEFCYLEDPAILSPLANVNEVCSREGQVALATAHASTVNGCKRKLVLMECESRRWVPQNMNHPDFVGYSFTECTPSSTADNLIPQS